MDIVCRSVTESSQTTPLEREGFEPSVPLFRHPSAHCSDTWCCGVGLCFLGTALLLCPGVRAAFRVPPAHADPPLAMAELVSHWSRSTKRFSSTAGTAR